MRDRWSRRLLATALQLPVRGESRAWCRQGLDSPSRSIPKMSCSARAPAESTHRRPSRQGRGCGRCRNGRRRAAALEHREGVHRSSRDPDDEVGGAQVAGGGRGPAAVAVAEAAGLRGRRGRPIAELADPAANSPVVLPFSGKGRIDVDQRHVGEARRACSGGGGRPAPRRLATESTITRVRARAAVLAGAASASPSTTWAAVSSHSLVRSSRSRPRPRSRCRPCKRSSS